MKLPILTFLCLCTLPARLLAVDLIVSHAAGPAGSTVEIPIRASDSTGISAVALTIEFDSTTINVEAKSNFFAPFGEQFGQTPTDSSVIPFIDLDRDSGNQLDHPFLTHSIPGKGLAIAGILKSPSDGSNDTLLTLLVTFDQQAAPGLYPIKVTPTILQNTASGHDPDGEAIDLLIAGSPIDGNSSILLSADAATAEVIPGSATLTAPGQDLDGDRLPDSWERQHFGDLETASADSDHDLDQFTDLMEFFFGSDPLRAEPQLALVPARAGEEFKILFPMRDDHMLDYEAEWTLDLLNWKADGVRIDSRPDLESGEGWTFMEATIESPDVPAMLFRIRLN